MSLVFKVEGITAEGNLASVRVFGLDVLKDMTSWSAPDVPARLCLLVLVSSCFPKAKAQATQERRTEKGFGFGED